MKENMSIQRVGKVLPGYHADTLSDEIANSFEFNNLCVYTLPKKLIELVQQQQPGLFSSEKIGKELKFAQLPETVVFEKGIAKPAKGLQMFNASIDETMGRKMFGDRSYQAVVEVLNGDLRKIDLIGKAYSGWLVQNSEYQADIDALFRNRWSGKKRLRSVRLPTRPAEE